MVAMTDSPRSFSHLPYADPPRARLLCNSHSTKHGDVSVLTIPPSPDLKVEAGFDEKDKRYRETNIPWTQSYYGRRQAECRRRTLMVALATVAGMGIVLLVYVLEAKTGLRRWGLVNSMEGMVGGKYLDIGDWRTGPSSRPRKSATRVGKASGRGKEKSAKSKESEVDDGLYRFNPADPGPHPIPGLIEKAQAEWATKVARQSKTLKAAVEEYRRRYKMAPPLGFEKWWAFIQQHNVPLPDEYDQISRDIHLFHPHHPSAIKSKMASAAKLSDTFVLKNTAGKITVQRNFDPAKHRGGEQRLAAQVGLVEDIAAYVGDFEAVWSVHDTGRQFMSWSQRRELEQALGDGTYLEEEEKDEQYGWSALCPMSTDFGAALLPKSSKATDSVKTFISSLPKALSICSHPTLVSLHGSTSGPYRVPSTTGHLPLFSYSRTSAHSDILGIPFSHQINLTPTPWEGKTEERLLWRGGLTGGRYDERVKWRDTQRFRLVDLAKRADELSLLIPNPSSSSPKIISTTYAKAAEHYLDVAFTGKPIQCAEATCDTIAKAYEFAPHMSHTKAAAYKYVMDVDGNAWSARFRGLLSTGTVVLKSTIMPEWWTDRAQAWVHFVPVDVGYGDLMDVMAYFTGDLSGRGGNDAAAQKIAEAGQDWAATHWRQEDMVAYAFRLYLEWARVWGGGDRKAGYVYDVADEMY